MASPERLLLLYDELDDAQRETADAHLRGHPDARTLVEEGRRLRRLIHAGSARDLSDEDLAAVIVARAASPQEPVEPLVSLARRIDAARAQDADLDARYRQLEERLREIGRQLPLASRQFERLTDPPKNPPKGNALRRDRRAPDRGRDGSRGGVPSSARFRTGLAVMIAAAVVAGVFVVIVESSRPLHVELAALHAAPETYTPPRLRGPELEEPPTLELYSSALETIHASRRTTLGLFPRYDEEGLRRAASLLEEVAANEPAGSALRLEALYIRGRVHLHMSEGALAEELLGEVVRREGPSAPEASEILHRLQRSR